MQKPEQDEVVGRRIRKAHGDSSQSDNWFNFRDFVYRLDTGAEFRMPWAYDRRAPLIEPAEIERAHKPLHWYGPKRRWCTRTSRPSRWDS